MKRRATVTDVAELAKVGASTVSRYLRGINVRPNIEGRIAKAIKELGYEPDQTARALRVGRTHIVGVIVPKVSNTFFARAVQMMEEEIRKAGCTMLLLTHQDRIEQLSAHLATIRRCKADGVILTGAPGATLKDIQSAIPETPMVAFDAYFAPEIDSVLLRNHESARIATEHLIRHGYHKIACVTAKPGIYSYQERAAGYAEAMTNRKLRTQMITAPDYEQLRYALDSAMQSKKRPTALLSLSDMCTLNILATYEELGLKPSERPPLIGFDDFDFAPFVDPPLTVIRQPIEKMARYALSLLFRRIDEETPSEAQSISLPGELVCRHSCGC